MRPTEKIKKLFLNSKVTVTAKFDNKVKSDTSNAFEKIKKTKSAQHKLIIWRYIMKNKITKFAVAACVILAVIFGMRFFVGGGTSVALADVLERVEQAQAFMYKIKSKTTLNMQAKMPSELMESITTILVSNEYGMKMDTDMNIVVNGVSQKMRQIMYTLPQENKGYTIMPDQKQYWTMEFDETIGERMKKEDNDPRDFLRKIVNCNYTDIGKSVIDGVEVEGFQTTDPTIMGGMTEDVNMILWVDRKTELPVREEIHYKVHEQLQTDRELYDFQWYVLVNADEFKPVIPQDYNTPLPGGYKMPSVNEEGAIDGLRFWEEILGRYPKKIDWMNLMNDIVTIKDSNNLTEMAVKIKEEIDKLPEGEKAQKILEITRPEQSLSMFYMTLVREKKEPAYYGEVVGPSDADKVLLRWKLSDTEYKVIYGDLKAETVSAEELAELESKLPK